MTEEIFSSFPQRKKKRAPRKISKSYLENAGLYYLERYASSAENFRRVMKRKIQKSAKHHEQDPEEFYPLLEEVIERYCKSGLLNDELYSFSKVRALRERGTSERMIKARLFQKGLAPDEIDRALEKYNEDAGYIEDESEQAAAEKFARKKRLGPYRMPIDPERRQKDIAAMARAGFRYEVIKTVLAYEDAAFET